MRNLAVSAAIATQRVGITAVGHYFPERVVTTKELEEIIRSDSDGLRIPSGLLERVSGIRSRHVAAAHEQASDLAAAAARNLMKRHQVDPASIDLLLFSSASRDFVEPATAHVVQDLLGTNAHALDVTNACNSFLNGMDIARAMILAGRARRVLVCSGELPTRAMRTKIADLAELHRSFAGYTFGDVGAAMVIEAVPSGGIISVDAHAYSEHWRIGGIFGGGTRYPRDFEHTYFHGDGEQLRLAFESVGAEPILAAVAAAGTSLDEIGRVLCHQVTVPYLKRFAEVIGVDMSRIVQTVDTYGNLASCSIPVQLSLTWDTIEPSERTLLVGLGGGASLALAVWEK